MQSSFFILISPYLYFLAGSLLTIIHEVIRIIKEIFLLIYPNPFSSFGFFFNFWY